MNLISFLVVAKSKLDPKLSVNHRLSALEDSVVLLHDTLKEHQIFLEAVPGRIKSAVPSDLKTQLGRLHMVLERLEEQETRSFTPVLFIRSIIYNIIIILNYIEYFLLN
jgi:hypothetical protein